MTSGRATSSTYCRDVETFICRKNDGHLIRIVGPAFELVSAWATDGVPLKVAFRGIERYFERYYRKGPRRRPVRVEFCDADVRDVFDEWRRAVGLTAGATAAPTAEDEQQGDGSVQGPSRRGPSLPAHLERAVARLTGARVSGRLGDAADVLIDRVSQELDAARSSSRGLRGEARQALMTRLETLDAEILGVARASLDETGQRALQREAEEDLAGFRATMPIDAYDRAVRAAIDQLVRERFGLPILTTD